ncbi:MAG: hypothetical protein SF053_03645 [Bacteroidia bacterium]|nr:hypothetical protein [Bacteroidia bacterium]
MPVCLGIPISSAAAWYTRCGGRLRIRPDTIRQWAGIGLIACLTLPGLLTWGYLRYQQARIRREVKHRIIRGLPDAALVRISLTREQASHELAWEKSDEFEYQGLRYDVVRTAHRGDTLVYWCWADYAETHLDERIQAVLALSATGQPDPARDMRERWYQFFKSWFLPAERVAWYQGHGGKPGTATTTWPAVWWPAIPAPPPRS